MQISSIYSYYSLKYNKGILAHFHLIKPLPALIRILELTLIYDLNLHASPR